MEMREVDGAKAPPPDAKRDRHRKEKAMEAAAVGKMETQLKLWGTRIDKFAARTQKAGSLARFEDLLYIDELKALLAIAQSKLDEFRAGGDAERARLEAEVKSACNELDAAFNNPKP
jgi:hypothetical protein